MTVTGVNTGEKIAISIMWRPLLLFALVHAYAHSLELNFPKHDAPSAIKGLIARRLGLNYVEQFSFAMIPTNEEDHDVATVKMDGGKIHLAASSATAMGYALHAYLKTVVHTQLDWDNHALKLPPVLPPVTSPLNMQKSTKYTYYLNVCTHSYTMWSWNWAQWETHIDWMVLNGINMPLAITGQEKIWQETFQRYNVTSLDRFFSGAAFLAWQRMGNIRGSWGNFGPLPTHFIEEQHILQLQLLERYRIFGMLPALPAFAGHVPEAIHLQFPMASMRQSERWAGYDEKYTCVWMLDPTDPLFLDIGKTFLDVQRALYGNYTSHIYQTDTYNELLPHTSDHAYLHASSKAVIDSMRASDPKAIWLMQGWLFEVSSSWWTQDKIKAYLDGVPDDQLIVLDLWSEDHPEFKATSNYYGKSWIYCILHTFGGNLGMHGNLPHLASAPLDALAQSKGQMIGMGLTMEGIYQNYIVYDFSLEMNWAHTPANVTKYVQAYVRRRYHSTNANAFLAWSALLKEVYSGYDKRDNLMTFRPNLNMNWLSMSMFSGMSNVIPAWKAMLQAATSDTTLASTDSFRHDLVDVTRQALSDEMTHAYHSFINLYHAPTTTTQALQCQGTYVLQLLRDMDQILGTQHDFLLGRWINQAKRLAKTIGDLEYFEYQARNQITKWGVGDTLNDYARKEWSGLVGEYYLGRWTIWIDHVLKAHSAKVPLDGRKTDDAIRAFEEAWALKRNVFPITETNDTVIVSKALFTRYGRKNDEGVYMTRIIDDALSSPTM